MIRAIVFLMILCCVERLAAGEAIREVGVIQYSKELSSYYFLYQKDNQTYANIISKKQKLTKNMIGKTFIIEGTLEWVRGSAEQFSMKEILTPFRIQPFEFSSLAFNARVYQEKEKYFSHAVWRERERTQGVVFEVSDETSNTLIAGGATVIGVLAGPVALIPYSVFGLWQLLN